MKEYLLKIKKLFFIFKLILTLETIEVKLEVGLGSVTKTVVAMCLSNLTADVQNWSSDVIRVSFFHFIEFYLLIHLDESCINSKH